MAITPNSGSLIVLDGESPFYTEESLPPPNSPSDYKPYYYDANIVQALASQSLQTMDTVTATAAGPNNIVATNNNGQLPSQLVSYLSGTLAVLKATPPSSIAICFATDVGSHGSFFLWFNNTAVGDNGWQLLGGS